MTLDAYADRSQARAEFIKRYRLLVESDIRLYLHYKGGVYEVMGPAAHTERDEDLVIYRHIWPHLDALWRARPADNFYGEVEVEGVVYQRFLRL